MSAVAPLTTTWLADLSPNRRWLLRGPGAAAQLEAAGIAVPEGLFDIHALGGDAFVSRTGRHEFFLHDGPDGALAKHFGAMPVYGLMQNTRVFPRDDCELALGGEGADAILSELCALDLGDQQGRYLLTRLAHVSVWLWAEGDGRYRIGCDPGFGEYLYETLDERVRERQGTVIGYREFYASD